MRFSFSQLQIFSEYKQAVEMLSKNQFQLADQNLTHVKQILVHSKQQNTQDYKDLVNKIAINSLNLEASQQQLDKIKENYQLNKENVWLRILLEEQIKFDVNQVSLELCQDEVMRLFYGGIVSMLQQNHDEAEQQINQCLQITKCQSTKAKSYNNKSFNQYLKWTKGDLITGKIVNQEILSNYCKSLQIIEPESDQLQQIIDQKPIKDMDYSLFVKILKNRNSTYPLLGLSHYLLSQPNKNILDLSLKYHEKVNQQNLNRAILYQAIYEGQQKHNANSEGLFLYLEDQLYNDNTYLKPLAKYYYGQMLKKINSRHREGLDIITEAFGQLQNKQFNRQMQISFIGFLKRDIKK